MTQSARHELICDALKRYQSAGKPDKSLILDELQRYTGYHRKYLLRAFKKLSGTPKAKKNKPKGRPSIYQTPGILEFIKVLHQSTNHLNGRRLVACIPDWLPAYLQMHPRSLTDHEVCLLYKISHATIERIIRSHRRLFYEKGYTMTRPGSLLKRQIMISTNHWDTRLPGFVEADTVMHSGGSSAPGALFTLVIVDIRTQWIACRAVENKSEENIKAAIISIEQSLPFPLLGFDSDNGTEFINHLLLNYFAGRTHPVMFTRSRPYHKNDNAHVEQKNWAVIRNYLSYARLSGHYVAEQLNELYINLLCPFINYYIPSTKLIGTKMVRDRAVKMYDSASTPFDRLMGSHVLAPDTMKHLVADKARWNPYILQKHIEKAISGIMSCCAPF